VTLQDVLRGLDAAAADSRVRLLLLRLGNAGIDFVHAQELADEIARFRRSGKTVIAFTESFDEGGETNSRYILAAAPARSGCSRPAACRSPAPCCRRPFSRISSTRSG
jgi:Periplasmic serine proteases (ClpP class)